MPLDLTLPFRPRDPLPVNSAFGKRPLYGDNHTGVDFNAYTNAPSGATVHAAGSGVVVESYDGNKPGQSQWAKLRGTMVVIDHGNDASGVNWKTRYHMLVPGTNIPKGRRVARGQGIGLVGSSGSSTTGPHCHFELWRNGVPVNPMHYLQYVGIPSASNTPARPIDNNPANSTPPKEIDDMYDADAEHRLNAKLDQEFVKLAGYLRRETRARWYVNAETGQMMVAKITDGYMREISSASQIESLKQNGYQLIASEEQPQYVDQLRWDNIRGEVELARSEIAKAVADEIEAREAAK